MKLITTDEQLRKHLPNVIASIKGETPLIQRLSLFLDLAENWVVSTFVSTSTFNTICDYTDSNIIKTLCSRLIVADAFLRAIPSLDIVLTPNGFGVVSTQNLAPASKSRVDNLTESMRSHRDDCIAALLPALVGASKWLASPQAQFFGTTLFPDFELVDSFGISNGSRWEKYLELRPKVIDLEASLAEEWFSPEFMSALRTQVLSHTLPETRESVVRQIKAQIIAFLKDGSFDSRRLADVVNYIRQYPDIFSEWHGSETAKLFAPPVFRNERKARGYFF